MTIKNDQIFLFYTKILPPYGMRVLRKTSAKSKTFPEKNKNFLDVGCGNSSPTKFINVFGKDYTYFGLDKSKYNMREVDNNKYFKIFILDLEKTNIKEVVNNTKFSVIHFSHVIEHLNNGESVISQFRELQPKGGLLYIETPSPESIHLKSSKEGTLNFYDDKTHKKVYSLEELEPLLIKNRYKILKSGKRKDWRRILIYQILIMIFISIRKPIDGAMLWDINGFANFVLCEAI